MIGYTGYKVSILEGRKSIDIIQAVKENHYDDSYVFSSEMGLNIAIAVFGGFYNDTHTLIDPSYGKIRFTKLKWSGDDKNEYFLEKTELKSHKCSAEELGLTGGNPKFWPAME